MTLPRFNQRGVEDGVPNPPDALVRTLIWGNIGALLVIVGWMAVITFQYGERSRQIDVNTAVIHDIQANGSQGTKARLDQLEKNVEDIRQDIRDLRDLIVSDGGKRK